MRTRSFLFCLLAIPAVAFADASDGQFMGYTLGADYQAMPQVSETTTTGNLLILPENPVKPADIEQVRLVATPQSRTIGYINAASWYATEGEARESARRYVELLRAKYPDWTFGREVMDASLRIVEVNFDKAPYNLQLRIVRDEHKGQNMWRFSMGLGWQPGSTEWLAWQDKSANQQSAEMATSRKQILEDADVRGL
ncbi:MAG: hypothetical protein OEV41_04335 [Gammaproteobacteria bacterium]|nr:hypothetical protein [Gammaproteobacteria bacterium]MDH5345251.1 hypothetical protein [Gammaproteobacteria bacterium]